MRTPARKTKRIRQRKGGAVVKKVTTKKVPSRAAKKAPSRAAKKAPSRVVAKRKRAILAAAASSSEEDSESESDSSTDDSSSSEESSSESASSSSESDGSDSERTPRRKAKSRGSKLFSSKGKKAGDKYCVRHTSHVVTVKRMLLTDALAQGNTKGWSDARIRAYQQRERNPNAYYYRFNDPGEQQATGSWKEEEVKRYMVRVKEVGVDGKWGIFAMGIPGRVGYQCSNLYRKLIEKGVIEDKNYVLDEKGKARYLKEKGKASSGQKGGSQSRGAVHSIKIVDGVPVKFHVAVPKVVKLRKPAVVKKSTGKHHHGQWLYKSVLVDHRSYKVGDKIWLTPLSKAAPEGIDNESKNGMPELRENIPAEIERITQVRNPKYTEQTGTDGAESKGEAAAPEKVEHQPWLPMVHCRRMYTLKQLKSMDETKECVEARGKKLQYEKEIFDSFETIEADALRIAGKFQCSFSRKISKDKDAYFGRYLVAPEAGTMLYRVGSLGDPLSCSALKTQIRQVLTKRKRAKQREEWKIYAAEQKRIKALEIAAFEAAEKVEKASRKKGKKRKHADTETGQLSSYELERKKNINRNQEYLAQLGL